MGQYDLEPQCILTVPLLEGLDGVRKMSKSYGNYIGINEPAADQFGKAMSVSDDLMWRYYELISSKSLDEIAALKKDVQESQGSAGVRNRGPLPRRGAGTGSLAGLQLGLCGRRHTGRRPGIRL